MPDIISRIKLEAQGADQAAREIRKLKEAYDEVADASKGIGASVGGGDPFEQATRSRGGDSLPESIHQRHQEDDRWQQQVQGRENTGMARFSGGGTLAGLNTGIGGMERLGAGQYGSAAGGALSGVGSLLGGPVGIAMLAGGALAMGTQKLANTEFERMGRLWGSGQSQRLGLSYGQLRDWEIGMGLEGIPLERVGEFISAASGTGFSANTKGASTAASYAMEAATRLGVDTSTSAGLLGALTRSGTGVTTAGYGMYKSGAGAFGVENLNMYLQELTRAVQTLSSQGIKMTADSFANQQGFLSGLSVFGGMSPDAAVAVNQTLQQRGISAAKLQSPEDLMAFQAMRKTGMSIFDTQIAMEQNPQQVTRAVYEMLGQRYGDSNSDAFSMKMMDYTGLSASNTKSLMKFFEETAGMSEKEITAEAKRRGQPWIFTDENGNILPQEGAERKTYSARNMQLLQGLEKSALKLTTELAGLAQVFTGKVRLNAVDVTFGGGLPGRFITDEDDRTSIQTGLDNLSTDIMSMYLKKSGAADWDLSKVDPTTIDWDARYEATVRGLLIKAGKKIPDDVSVERKRELQSELYNLEGIYQDQFDVKDAGRAVDLIESILWALEDQGFVFTDGNDG